ncbi:MAG: hypothetical protein OXG46_07375 [Chloroflexi bacterium]|nr:hypothetical protein [Chloroflexota bacterium]MCY3936747.1 hypothetical protein [Chloroflexota bacterium]
MADNRRKTVHVKAHKRRPAGTVPLTRRERELGYSENPAIRQLQREIARRVRGTEGRPA